MYGLPGTTGFNKRHQLPFVVSGAASSDDLAGWCVFNRWLERRSIPQLKRIDRLHVVMAIEQKVRAVAFTGMFADNHRMPGSLVTFGIESYCRQIIHQPISRPHTRVCVSRVRRDAVNSQQLKQPRRRRLNILINVFENGGRTIGSH